MKKTQPNTLIEDCLKNHIKDDLTRFFDDTFVEYGISPERKDDFLLHLQEFMADMSKKLEDEVRVFLVNTYRTLEAKDFIEKKHKENIDA